jgi:hypothetical protein
MTGRRCPCERGLQIVASFEETSVSRAPAGRAHQNVRAPPSEFAMFQMFLRLCQCFAEAKHQRDVILAVSIEFGQRVQRFRGEIVSEGGW